MPLSNCLVSTLPRNHVMSVLTLFHTVLDLVLIWLVFSIFVIVHQVFNDQNQFLYNSLRNYETTIRWRRRNDHDHGDWPCSPHNITFVFASNNHSSYVCNAFNDNVHISSQVLIPWLKFSPIEKAVIIKALIYRCFISFASTWVGISLIVFDFLRNIYIALVELWCTTAVYVSCFISTFWIR